MSDLPELIVGTIKAIDGGRLTIETEQGQEVVLELSWKRRDHLWPCGCLRNDGGAHRGGCPLFPEGVRGD